MQFSGVNTINFTLNMFKHLKDTLETLQKNHDDWTTLSPSLLWSSLLQLSPIIHSGTWSMVIKKSSLTGLNIRRYLHTANDDANTTTAYQTTSKLATALMQYQNENGLISSHQPKSKSKSKSKYFGNNLDFLYDEPSNKETNKKNNSSANQVFDDMEAEMKAASNKKQNKTTIVIDDDSENDQDDDDLEFEELESTSSSSSTRRPAKRKAPTGNSSEDEDADSDKDSDEDSDKKVQRSKKRIKLSRKSKKKVKYQESSEDEDEDEDEEDRQLDQDSKKKDSDSDSDFEELPKQRRRRRKAAPVEISSSDEEDNQDDDQVEGLSKHQRDKAAREKRMKNERRNQSTMRTRMRGQEKYADNLCVYCGDYIEEKYRDPTNDGDTYCGKYSSEGERASSNGSTVVDISMTLSSFKPISLSSRCFLLF